MTGAAFDLWDSTGTRHADCDRFSADDLVAVSFLSVDIPARAAMALLRDQKDEFSALLVRLARIHRQIGIFGTRPSAENAL
jgi:hypothetical protein